MMPSLAGRVRGGLTLVLTGLVVWMLVRRFTGGEAVLSVVRAAHPAWVAASIAASTACVLLGTERWRIVLAAMGYELSYVRALEVVLATWPLAMVTPSRASDLLRPLAVQSTVPLAAGTGSVLAEKAIDLVLLMLLGAVGAALQRLWAWAGVMAVMSVVEATVISVIVIERSFIERLGPLRSRREAVEQLLGALAALWRAPHLLVAQIASSLGIRFLTIAIAATLLLSVDAQVPLFDTVTLWPTAALVGLAPVTLGGVGTRDAAFIELLAARGIHVEAAQVLAATVGYSAIAIGLFAIVGLPFMIREMLRGRQ
jgi:uncharacterized protein (TIRG00374 family)